MAGRRLVVRTYVLNQTGDPVWFGPDDDVPAWAAKLIDDPAAWADGAGAEQDNGDADPEGPVDYSKLSKKELEDEIDERNQDREDDDLIEVETPGNKAELIAALQGDDAAQAG